MRFNVTLAMSVTFLLAIGVLFANSILGATIEVPSDYPTIQNAIDAACYGDTILVASGVYEECIELRNGLILQGEVIDDSRPTILSAGSSDCVVRGAPECIVSDFIVDGNNTGTICVWCEDFCLEIRNCLICNGQFGFFVLGLSDATIQDCVITNMRDYGGYDDGVHQCPMGGDALWCLDDSSPTITGCSISHTAGVSFSYNSGGTVANCVLTDNVFGMGFDDTSLPVVRNNVIRDHAYAGLFCASDSAPTIESNQIIENCSYGVSCAERSHPELRDNIIKNNTRFGIACAGYSAPTVEANTITENLEAGVACLQNSAPIVQANQIARNGAIGVGCEGTSRPEVRDNVINENIQAGVSCFEDCGPTVESNEIVGNGVWGVTASGTSHPLVQNNSIRGNLDSGIVVQDDSAAIVQGNHITTNGCGVFCASTRRTEITANTIIENLKAGVICAGDSAPVVEANQITLNGIRGVYCCGTSHPDMRNNTICGNSEGGVFCSDDSAPVVEANQMTSNGMDGVYCCGTSRPAVRNNTICRNGLAAVSCWNDSAPIISGNIIVKNLLGIYVENVGRADLLTVNYNDVWCNASGNYYANDSGRFDPLPGWVGEISEDPLFRAEEREDFRLSPGSPCIDAGDPDPQYNDPDGSRNDIGAYGGPNAGWIGPDFVVLIDTFSKDPTDDDFMLPDEFAPGDAIELKMKVRSKEAVPVWFFMAVQVGETYYFYPDWSPEVKYLAANVPEGLIDYFDFVSIPLPEYMPAGAYYVHWLCLNSQTGEGLFPIMTYEFMVVE